MNNQIDNKESGTVLRGKNNPDFCPDFWDLDFV